MTRQSGRGVISSRLTERQIRARVSLIQKTGVPKVSDGTHEETRGTRVEHAHRHPQRGLLPGRCRMLLAETRGEEESRETAEITLHEDKMRRGRAFHVVKKAM